MIYFLFSQSFFKKIYNFVEVFAVVAWKQMRK